MKRAALRDGAAASGFAARQGRPGRCWMAILAVLAAPLVMVAMAQDTPKAPPAAKETETKPAVDKAAREKEQAKLKEGIGRFFKGFFAPPAPQRAVPEPPSTRVVDQATLRRLDEADRLLGEGRIAPALTLLQMVLDGPGDSDVRSKDQQWMSARQRAEELILAQGAAGLQEYRRHYADEAADLLQRGQAGHDPSIYAQVVRRFFLTEAGFDATNLLASYQLDLGNPAVAVFYLDRLLNNPAHRERVTDAMRAKRAVALGLMGRTNDAKGMLDGIRLPQLPLGGTRWLPAAILEAVANRQMPANEVAKDWTVFGGNPQRSAVASGGLPLLSPDISMPISSRKAAESMLSDIVEINGARKAPTLLEIYPLAIGGKLYYRDFQGTRAVDLKSGKVLWKTSEGGSIDAATEKAASDRYSRDGNLLTMQFAYVSNSVYGSISADKQRLYQIDSMVLNSNMFVPRMVNRTKNPDYDNRGRNRLVALDLETGEPVWTINQLPGLAGGPMEDVYFFGPPLPIGQDLYVLGEARSEVRLCCLKASTGQVSWTHVLETSDRRIDSDMFRRSQACQITYSNGILLCPTNVYKVAAIDPLTRMVLWEYSYAEDLTNRNQYIHASQVVPPPSSTWATDPPIVSGGKVVVTSAQSRRIHCLDLQTGARLWSADRGVEHFVGGVFGDIVLLIGGDHVRALDMETGKQRWYTPTSMPSGRGIAVDKQYLLPLSTGKILALDLASGGKSTEVAARGEGPVGNLLVHDRRVIASGSWHKSDDETCGIAMDVYPLLEDVRLEVDRLLAEDTEDTRGLFLRAQVRLAERKVFDAIDDLLAALHSPSDVPEKSRARTLLFDIVSTEAMDSPAKVGGILADLKALATDSQQRGAYDRLLAEHCLVTKDYRGALKAVESHASLTLNGAIAGEQGVVFRQPAVWTRYFMNRLFATVDGDEREELLATLEEKLEKAAAADDIGRLQEFASNCVDLPIGVRATSLVGERLLATGRRSEAELAFLKVAGSEDRQLAATALARLAEIAELSSHPADSVVFLEQLADRYPAILIDHKKTGRQLLDEFQQRAGAAVERRPLWDYDVVLTKVDATSSSVDSQMTISPSDERLPFFGDRLFVFEQNVQKLTVTNKMTGRAEWSIPLPSQNTGFSYSQQMRCEQLGHLFFFTNSDMVYAVSGLDRKVVWSRPAKGTSSGLQSASIMTSLVGPVGPGFVGVRSGKSLLLLDPWTHKELWGRRNLRPDENVFGDDQYLFIVARDGSYVAHRTLDGQVLRKGNFKNMYGQNKDIFGRHLLVIKLEGVKMVVRMWDPWFEKDLWRHEFPVGTRNYLGQDRQILMLEPTGKMTLLDRQSGAVLVTDDLGNESSSSLVNLSVFEDRDRYYVAFNNRSDSSRIWYMPATPNLVTRSVNGSLRAYDRKTQELVWERTLLNRSIVTNPGGELPVLVAFGTRIVDRRNQRQLAMSIEVVDKKDGKTLHAEDRDEYAAFSEIAYDTKDRWAELRSWNLKVRMDFLTEKEAAARASETKPATLLEAFEKLRKVIEEAPARAPKPMGRPLLPPPPKEIN